MTLSVVFFGAIHKVGFDWVQFDNEIAPYVGFGSMSGLTFTASQRYLQFDEMVAGYTAVMEIDGPPDLPDGHIDFTLTIDSLPGAEPSTGAVSLDYPSDRSPVFDSWNNDALLNSSSIEFNDRAGCGSAPPVTTIVTGSDQTANFPMYVRVEYTVVAHVFEDCSVNGNPDSESGVLGYIVTVDKVEWVADGSGDRTTLYSSLTADFSGTPLAGGAPLSVAFTDASTGSPTSWLWDFGDGNTSTDQNPTHVYTADGVYTVALTATNIDGSDTETKVDYITVASPVADFSGTPTSGTVTLSVDFTDLSTNVPTSWFWDFGDGGSSTSQNPTYVYNYIGTYTVTLTATNGSGSDSETKVAYITVTAVVEYGAAVIENCDIDTGGAAVGLRVADVAIARDNRLESITVDASAELRAKDNSYTTLVNNGTLQPLAGDRAVFDAISYAARHTNDADDSVTAIHHTLGTGATQAAAGNHAHSGTLSNALTNTHIFVGNGVNVATDVAMSNDATMANTGAITLKNTGPGATGPIGSATVAPIITIDAQGRVTALSSATISAGGAGQVIGLARWAASSGQTTFDLPDTAEQLNRASDNGSIVDPATVTLTTH